MEETFIGKYKILDEIGRGGMGIVYRGEQVSLKRTVAIKTLPSELAHDQEYLDRIENEARILAKFSHPCIVYIHDVEKQADAIYLIMEYVPGITVAERIRNEGPYEIKEAARIIVRVASALDHAHNKGIIHRDIKPSNIMIREDDVVKVTDFGIAKSSEPSDMTRMRFTPGTRDYMSPEQAQGNRELDGRSDIYSLGIVFYQMVTGKLPPTPLPSRLTEFPPRYAKLLKKCLAVDISQRYSTARELINSLDEADKKAPGSKIGKNTGQRPQYKISVIGGALGAVLLVVLFIWQFDQIKQYADFLFVKSTGKEDSAAPAREKETIALESPEEEPPDLSKIPAISPKEEPSPLITVPVETTDPEPGPDTRPVLSKPPEQIDEKPMLSLPVLRSALTRNNEILSGLRNRQGISIRSDIRRIFALKTGFIENTPNRPDLSFSVKALIDQMEMVRSDDPGDCDLLFNMNTGSNETSLTIHSNVSGDDAKDAYQEHFYFSDDQHLLSSLETIISRYYCLNILKSLDLLNPADDAYAAGITIKGGHNGMFRVGETIRICMDSRLKTYSSLLSVNLEGLYLLFPQTREEHVSHLFKNPICSEPMAVSPPTGTVLVVAILFADKTLLPLDPYLAGEEQVLIEPASWPYDLSATDNAVEFSENLFLSLYSALPGKYSTKSRFIKTYN